MKVIFRLCSLVAIAVTLSAQSLQQPATASQLHYLRHLLLILGSPDASSQSVAMRERSLAIQFGLTQQEVAGIDSASKQYGAFLLKIKDFIKTSPTDDTGLASLVSDRKQMEESLANQILQTVRPSTANQLRSVGDVVFQMTGH